MFLTEVCEGGSVFDFYGKEGACRAFLTFANCAYSIYNTLVFLVLSMRRVLGTRYEALGVLGTRY